MEQKEKSKLSVEFIINCAINEIVENGFDFSLNTICKKNSISKGKLYHHFESKDQLIGECVCYSLKCLIDNIKSFELDSSITVKENFHKFYYDRMMHWQKNFNHLTILRYAYAFSNSFLSKEALDNIKNYLELWKQAKREKIIAILNSNNDDLRIDAESIAEVMLVMYENTFQILENKMINAVKLGNEEEIKFYTEDLINYHDAVIDMILYGAIK